MSDDATSVPQRDLDLTSISDLGKIKYLKDADDNDLDPQQFVSDVFVDEGKAEVDGSDQNATFKVIQDQRQAIRLGSVVPDLTPVHFQPPPRPPVPTFGSLEPSLGKHARMNSTDAGGRASQKRARLEEIEETQDEEQVIPSVERSPEVIEDTQTLATGSGPTRAILEQTLRELSGTRTQSTHESSPAPPLTNGTRSNGEPMTPPTDASRNRQGLKLSAASGRSDPATSSNSVRSSSSTRFKPPQRPDLFALPPDSDIEDSQVDSTMEPTSNKKTPKRRTTDLDIKCSVLLESGRPCGRNLGCNRHKLPQKRAVAGRSKPFDELREEQRRVMPEHTPGGKRRGRPPKATTEEVRSESSQQRMEPSGVETNSGGESNKEAAHPQGAKVNKTATPSKSTTTESEESEDDEPDSNRRLRNDVDSNVPRSANPEPDASSEASSSNDKTATGTTSEETDSGDSESQADSEVESTTSSAPTPKVNSPKPSAQYTDRNTGERSNLASTGSVSKQQEPHKTHGSPPDDLNSNAVPQAVQQVRKRKRVPDLDSPGEQLSYDLQESAQNEFSADAVKQKLSKVSKFSKPKVAAAASAVRSSGKTPTRVGLGITATSAEKGKHKDIATVGAERTRTPQNKLQDAKNIQTPKKDVKKITSDTPLPSIEKPKPAPISSEKAMVDAATDLSGSIASVDSTEDQRMGDSAPSRLTQRVLPRGMTNEEYERRVSATPKSATPIEINKREQQASQEMGPSKKRVRSRQKAKENAAPQRYSTSGESAIGTNGNRSESTNTTSSNEKVVADAFLKAPATNRRISSSSADPFDAVNAKLKGIAKSLSPAPVVPTSSGNQTSGRKKKSPVQVDSLSKGKQPPAKSDDGSPSTTSQDVAESSEASSSDSASSSESEKPQPPAKNTPKPVAARKVDMGRSSTIKPMATPKITKTPATPSSTPKTVNTKLSYGSARGLQDILKVYEQENSKQSSPAPKVVTKPKSFVRDESSSDEESDSDNVTDEKVAKKAKLVAKKLAKPDPSIRDRSSDDEDEESDSD